MVAYPQNPDAVRTLLGLLPDDLCQMLAVQYVGGDRTRVRREPSLMVSVQRLRAAFAWLLENNWPWMQATKYEDIVGPENLGSRLESLLTAYVQSTGTSTGAVPAELVQGATEIRSAEAPIQQAGPSDSLAGNATDSTGESPPDDSAALLQGGIDELDPFASAKHSRAATQFTTR